MKTKKPLMLHLGCGKRRLPGFVHVDLAKFPHIKYRRPISDLRVFKSGSAGLIYSSHAFEYFDRAEAVKVLKEWRRVLRKGGTLRLAVPDFEAMVKVYLKYGKDLEHQGILGPLFGKWPIPGAAKTVYHKTTYDFKSLKKILEANGFTNVRRYHWKKALPEGYDDYSRAYVPHMDERKGILISLNVEARKK
jgi:predicted SAM-dependent methyltransferase